MSSPQSQAKRRVPPPCWTHDETLTLIEAYKERWFGLGRGSLKASDWDDVSAAVCSDSGNKSSVQCRHKIEKLRKRYRTEKQRGLTFPGKFFSSWDLFPLLDSMNFVPSSGSGDQDQDQDQEIVADGARSTQSKNSSRYDGFSGSNLGYEHEYGDRFASQFAKFRDLGVKKDVIVRSNGRNIDGYGSIVDGFPVRSHGDRSLIPPPGFKSKNFRSNLDYDDAMEEYGIDNGRGKASDWDSIPPGIPLKKKPSRIDDFEALNGYHSSSRPHFATENNNGGGVKRGLELDPVEDMVSTIEVLADSFVKMERMKMEMVTEMEKMRMEMEMKHNKMILESQQKLVDAFANALLENKKRKKKTKVMMLPPDTNLNGDEAEYST